MGDDLLMKNLLKHWFSNLDEKLKEAFTTYYTDRTLYETEILAKEKTENVTTEFGEEFCQLSGGQYRVMKVNVTDVKFAS